jgi:hypothetical protein
MRLAPESRAPYLWLLSIFAISRLIYFAAGVRFDASPIDLFFQFVDPVLLKTRLLESLFYLHTQPPGFNFMVGVVLKLFPIYYGAVLHAIYLICGVSLGLTLYRLMRILEVRQWTAIALAALFLVSPGVLLFENLLIYEYPLMALLCAAGVVFYRLIDRPSAGAAVGFFACLAALVYVRALFHLAWFILLMGFCVWRLRGHRRLVLASASVPLLLILALYTKNWVLFGSFSSSTWLGFNAETITTHQLTEQEHRRLVDSGLLSRIGLRSTYLPLSYFRDVLVLPPPKGIPVLDQPTDSTGRPNYNNSGYLLLHPYYLADAKQIILHYPKAYLRTIEQAWFAYFLPTGDFPFFVKNRPRIQGFDRAFNVVFFGQWKDASDRGNLRRIEAEGHSAQLPLFTGTYLLVGLPLLFALSSVRLWQTVRIEGWTPRASLLAFLLFNIGFITAVVNFLSCFENNRYRLPIDPFFLVLLATAVSPPRRSPGRTRSTGIQADTV